MGDIEHSGDRGDAQARVTLLGGLALIAIAAALTLTRSPSIVSHTNGISPTHEIATVSSGAVICQGGEMVPRDTSAIRLSLFSIIGPSVELQARSGGRIVTHGNRGAGWIAGSVTVPVEPLLHSAASVTICVKLGKTLRQVLVAGQATAPPVAVTTPGGPRRGRVRIEYLRAGATSWWSSILPIARRMGLGHAFPGTWIVVLLAALMATASAIALRVLSDSSLEVSRRAWACALVACLNAACWSFLTPPFEAPDEPDHYAYVQQLAETGRLPSSSKEETYSSQETTALQYLLYNEVRQSPQTHTIASIAQQRELERNLALALSQTDNDGATGVSASEPPLYYALQTIPYRLSANVLDRVELMRLLSALFAGVTALFTFLFLREALPGTPRSWSVGALCVALCPLLGFISGAVNPDSMLAAIAAALFFCLARGFRRGLTPRLALATGALIALGLLTKLNFLGLAPGALLGLVVLGVHEARTGSAGAAARARSLLLGPLAIAAAPACAYVAVNVLSHNPTLGQVSTASRYVRGPVTREISYIWQLYLPRLPGMHAYFPGVATTRELWFDRVVGLYGWLDTVFPGWVYDLAIVPAGLIAVLCVRALVIARANLRRRAGELAVYATLPLGVLALVGADSYINSFNSHGELYAEPRYLLPLAALAAAALALAARGAGRRWTPVLGALIVTTILAQDIFSQLQVIARYYG